MLEMAEEKIKIRDSVEEINDTFYKNGWTDGLPIIPPTEDNVSRMINGTIRERNEVIARIPPKMGIATVEKIAINAVMAGRGSLLRVPFLYRGDAGTRHSRSGQVLRREP